MQVGYLRQAVQRATNKICAIIPVDDPSPIAFINVFEEGDYWEKIKGCEECPEENKARCCGNCYWFMKGGHCHWQCGHLQTHSSKPFHCITKPIPSDYKHICVLEFKCIKGSKEGKIRRVRDKKDVFH